MQTPNLQLIQPKSNQEAMEAFIKAHYIRPDNQERDYQRYLPEETEFWQAIFAKLPLITQMVIYYTNDMELHIIFTFESGTKEDDLLQEFQTELQGEANNIVYQTGQSTFNIYYNQSY